MFTVKKAMNREGYMIGTPERGMRDKPVYAKDTAEIVEAVRHYFGLAPGHDEFHCPFCKAIKKGQ